jgi:uncharacterized protein (DUF433 family)
MVLMPLITVVEDKRSRTPVFYGTQVPVRELTTYLRTGKTIESFLLDFPGVSRHQVEQFLAAAETLVVAAADAFNSSPLNMGFDFDQLAPADLVPMSDDQLWQWVDYRPDWMRQGLFDELNVSARETPLTDAEKQVQANLLRSYHHFVLIRSQALLLLKQRGHDVESHMKSSL